MASNKSAEHRDGVYLSILRLLEFRPATLRHRLALKTIWGLRWQQFASQVRPCGNLKLWKARGKTHATFRNETLDVLF